MQFYAILRILGLLLVIFSSTQIPPMIVSFIYLDGAFEPFFYAFAVTLITGITLWLTVKNARKELRLRDGFLIVVLFWTVLGLFGAIPFVFLEGFNISVTDAIFESISGLTTTGATVFSNLEKFPESVLYYRQQLQWLGGMGIIVLAVAIMPMLGIGGMQLYRAETPGPLKDSKLTPRITETAKALWYIYLSLTVACMLAYWVAGMNLFDAIAHSFSTIAIGGFSPYDASMGHFNNNPAIEIIAIIFMLLAGINFALHFVAWRSKSVLNYFKDTEFKVYFSLLLSVALISSVFLYILGKFDLAHSFIHGTFQAVSIGTTTGFTTASYHEWPYFLAMLLLFTSFIGACAGSTGGGMKVIRFLLLIKQGLREIARVIHPNAVISIKVGGKPLPDRVIQSVWGFFSVYVATFTIIMLVLLLLDPNMTSITAFSATAASINNLGPGLEAVGSNYGSLEDSVKWVLTFAMLLGRLEIFTLLVLLTPSFWRR